MKFQLALLRVTSKSFLELGRTSHLFFMGSVSSCWDFLSVHIRKKNQNFFLKMFGFFKKYLSNFLKCSWTRNTSPTFFFLQKSASFFLFREAVGPSLASKMIGIISIQGINSYIGLLIASSIHLLPPSIPSVTCKATKEKGLTIMLVKLLTHMHWI